MARFCTWLFSFLNLVILIVGLLTIGASVYFRLHDSSCQKFLQDPLLIIGLVLLVVSVLGLVGSCCNLTFVLWIYSFITYILIIGSLAFGVFALLVTNKDAGKALSHVGKLRVLDTWLRDNFVKGSHWDNVKSCLADVKVCKNFENNKPSLVQSGCCKPPESCGFVNDAGLTWKGKAAPKSDPDCTTWNNDLSKLCFDCNSCKEGFLEEIRKEWRILAMINAGVFVFFIFIYATSCCARRGIRSRSSYKHY